MAIYNISNMTGNNLYEVAREVTVLEPNYGNAILLTFVMLVFFTLIRKNSWESSAMAATFTGSIIAVFLRPTGIVTQQLFVIMILAAAGTAAYGIWTRDK